MRHIFAGILKFFTQPLDRIGFCLLKMSDNLDLIQIEKFKNSVSVSDDQCLQYVRRQCVSSEDIIFTVHIGCDCLRCLCMGQSENVYYKSHVAAMSSFFWVCCKERQKKVLLALNNQEHFFIDGDSYFPPSLF